MPPGPAKQSIQGGITDRAVAGKSAMASHTEAFAQKSNGRTRTQRFCGVQVRPWNPHIPLLCGQSFQPTHVLRHVFLPTSLPYVGCLIAQPMPLASLPPSTTHTPQPCPVTRLVAAKVVVLHAWLPTACSPCLGTPHPANPLQNTRLPLPHLFKHALSPASLP